MDLKLVKKLLDLISESDVDEVAIEEGDFKIKVKKQSEVMPANLNYQLPAQPRTAAAQSQQNPEVPHQTSVAEESQDSQPSGELVRSPIVGTFYQASSPDSEPFVKAGDHIEQGQPLCIIEAMKIMNEIEAEFSGTIEKILVKDAQPVEFDQPLFVIEKD